MIFQFLGAFIRPTDPKTFTSAQKLGARGSEVRT